MKISKNIRYLVRVRDYETIHVEVGAEADFRDLGIADNDLAHMRNEEFDTYSKRLRALVDSEVHELARSELETISEWSEIEPNLAQDFLHSLPPAYLQRRTPHARDQKTAKTTNRPLKRGGGPPSPPSAA